MYTRREFGLIAAATLAIIGAVAALWPFNLVVSAPMLIDGAFAHGYDRDRRVRNLPELHRHPARSSARSRSGPELRNRRGHLRQAYALVITAVR